MSEFTLKQYQATRLLGQGGMARVYLALDTINGTEVALKVSRLSAPYSRETLKNEYANYQKLDHECFPRVYELIEDGERLVMVMEALEGQTLEDLMGDLQDDPERALSLIIKVTEAMSHAGKRGVIHADLKPANILVSDDDEVKIIDFGLATGATTLTAEDIKEIRGTISYLSPEQAEGLPLDVRSDVFSVGVILYEALVGRRPFDSIYDMATLYSIMYEEPPPPSRVNERLGAIVDRALAGMLAKDPAERYPDFQAVSQTLEALSGNLSAEDGDDSLRLTVSPFNARSASEDDSLFAEGLTEELIRGLSQLESVDVTPLALVQEYQKEELLPAAARDKFGSDFLLSGTIRRAGDRIRVTVTLVETRDSTISWSDKYDSLVADLFDLQDTVSAAIVTSLQAQLSSSQEVAAPRVSRGTDNVEAYEFYLRARSYLTRNTREDMDYARKMLESSIEIDPEYPLAYAGMADLHGSMWMNYHDRTDDRWNLGAEMARKAIALDTSLPNGYRAYGRLLHLKGRYQEAIEQLERAASMDASYSEVYRTLAWACEGMGDLKRSLAWTRKALSVNPHSEETILLQGIIYSDLNNMPQSINAFMRCLEIKPDYGRAHYSLARAYQKMGRFKEALPRYERADKHGGQPDIILDYGWLMFGLGRTEEAISLLERGCRERSLEFTMRYYLGVTQESANRLEQARENYQKALELSLELISSGDTTMYPQLITALSQAALGIEGLGEQVFLEAEKKITANGELALMCARYAARRQMPEKVILWLGRALNWRMGVSLPEALLEPSFADYHEQLQAMSVDSQAA